jgi:hypothetical protein
MINYRFMSRRQQNYEYDQYVIIELYSVSLNDPELVVANAARVLSDINKSQQ